MKRFIAWLTGRGFNVSLEQSLNKRLQTQTQRSSLLCHQAALPRCMRLDQVFRIQDNLKQQQSLPSEHTTLLWCCQGKEYVKMSVLVFSGKYFDTLSKIVICFSSFAFDLKPMESKSAALISDIVLFGHVFFNSMTSSLVLLKFLYLWQ